MKEILCVDNMIRLAAGGVRLIKPLSFEGKNGENIYIHASESRRDALFDTLIGLKEPDSGKIFVCGKDLYDMPEMEIAAFRCHIIGAIPSAISLLPEVGTTYNVSLPQLIDGKDENEIWERIQEISFKFIPNIAFQQKAEALSPFRKRVISIIRAVINSPQLLVFDDFVCDLEKKEIQEIWNIINLLRPANSLLIFMSSMPAQVKTFWSQIITL